MRALVRLATKVARADVPVLVTGPNGAGKEKIAELVQSRSARRDRPFVKVNVGALPDELLEAELFGAEAGAFGRALESSADGKILQEMADAGQIEIHEFEGREKMLELVQPVQEAYAAELGASDLLEKIRGM